ncbi:hypothetical protein L596_007638 [Steinernema carpocapsae]|uniref:Uncharacterized protein n=1 Tax=Steinernema carpocapsae TaxID=34508 RepID=A0A4U5PAY8_STECR|nr:hypothetical protein L596_007638 [Steinernema carpocapsae]
MLLVFLAVFLGLFAAPVSPKSRLCKQATTQTMRELKNEYDSYMGDAEGQKSVRKIMVVREEACGSVFPKMYLNDDNRPMVSQSDRCKPEEFADCIYGEADEDNRKRTIRRSSFKPAFLVARKTTSKEISHQFLSQNFMKSRTI